MLLLLLIIAEPEFTKKLYQVACEAYHDHQTVSEAVE